ncbi:hypothetical protein [Pedobacter sp. GR22-10]|uniref:hypothetical protein n=1 Tax=Pedobacter sp. GR22-10 TaxID=2994472 RepID=UPI002247B8A9|nr:hypothetical protein [Pedobacter sp. GR22-10]MCX2432830.1 hypothetical protein [Pedobacter sp. GR22-10]
MLELPKTETNVSTTTDLATIALTLAGFVLTLLTVLITFKTGARLPNSGDNEDVPLFDLFFSTGLYYRTTSLLKGCIKSLIFVAMLGFSLKLFLPEAYLKYIFFANVLGLIIIATTLWRSLLILTNIIKLQREG